MIPTPTYVIFDMDGTTVRHIHPWILNLMERLDDLSYSFGSFYRELFYKKNKKKDNSTINRGAVKKKRLLVHRAIHFLRQKEVAQIVEPCPGIFEVLNTLKSRNIPLGLASNGLGKGYGHDILQTFGLEDYFQVTIFREDIERSKPHPEAILRVIDGFERSLTDQDVVWYIGDRWKDVQAAFAAAPHLQCQIIPFAYGLNATLQAFIDGKLTYRQRIGHYSELLQVLEE